MNQILSTKLKNKKDNRKFFKLQFSFSLLFAIVSVAFLVYTIMSYKKEETKASRLIGNYNIYRLYANYGQEENVSSEEDNNGIFGLIEIPKLQINYPVFSYLNEELLKTSPCKFYGTTPKENGNICIAGHNYNNNMFFSNLYLLENDDEIFLYDYSNNKYIYKVYRKYEVVENDLSPITDYDSSKKELTLVTCNNLNQNRLIIKALQVDS